MTGASGCVGRAVISAGLRSGWSVRGFARSERPRWWPKEVPYIRGSVEDVESVVAAVGRADAVVHLAAPAHATERARQAVAARHRVTVEGTANVARAARISGARLVLMSSIAVYGNPPSPTVDQNTRPHPTNAYGIAKLEAEERCGAEVPRAVVLRCSVIYGPGDRGNVGKLIRAVDRGRAFVVGDGRNRKSLLSSHNLADRILLALANQLEGTWCVADSPAPSQRELLDEIARALGRPAPRSLPLALAQAGARAVDSLARLGGRSGGWDSTIKTLSSWSVVDGSALDVRLGYGDATQLRDGLASTIAWMRSESIIPPRP